VLTAWFCRRRGIASPGRALLALLYGFGLGLHILFDCITSFGTLVWSPISWTRVSWDWTFIVDVALTAVLLYFLLLGWLAGGDTKQQRVRRAAVALLLMAALLGLYLLACYSFGQSPAPAVAAGLILVAAGPFCLSLVGVRLPLAARTWCCVGLLATAGYLGLDSAAHHRALERVRQIAAAERLEAPELAALPLPPNFTVWSGFARTPQQISQWTISLANPAALPARVAIPAVSGAPCPEELWTLPQVRSWMRFARFPIVECRGQSGGESARFTDLRFLRPPFRWEPLAGAGKPIPFTWQVTVNDQGRITREGWVVR